MGTSFFRYQGTILQITRLFYTVTDILTNISNVALNSYRSPPFVILFLELKNSVYWAFNTWTDLYFGRTNAVSPQYWLGSSKSFSKPENSPFGDFTTVTSYSLIARSGFQCTFLLWCIQFFHGVDWLNNSDPPFFLFFILPQQPTVFETLLGSSLEIIVSSLCFMSFWFHFNYNVHGVFIL